MVSTDSIRELAEPVLASAGLELWDVEITRDVVRIMVDRPALGTDAEDAGARRGVDLDDLSAASSALSPLLDEHPEVVPDSHYQLEVSSPGVERTLRTPDQYRRYLGTDITVKTAVPVDSSRRHRGLLLEVGPDGIVIEPDDAAGTRLDVRYDQIDRARTVLVWGPTPGGPARGRRTPAGEASRATAALNPKDAGL